MNGERIEAWVTEHALTKGIQLFDGLVYSTYPNMFFYGHVWAAHGYFGAVGGKDWHKTYESAVARAEQMRQVEIASLKKSIAKMEALKFTAPTE